MNELKSVTIEVIAHRIYVIRGKKVMFDRDLAQLYGMQTFRLNEQIKRNKKRFPHDFMFQLHIALPPRIKRFRCYNWPFISPLLIAFVRRTNAARRASGGSSAIFACNASISTGGTKFIFLNRSRS